MSTRRSIYVSDLTNFDQDYEEEFTAWTRENNMEWRNIIFLPFESTWLFVVNTSILLNALICVYYVAYTKVGSNMTKIDVVYYIFELLYLFDTFLYILHRNMTRHRIRKEYEPKSLLLLTVDVVTLLPVYEFFVLVDYASYEKHSYLTLRMLVRIKSFFRMYNVYSYLKRLQNRAGLNQLMVLGVEQAVKVVVISHILGAIWYYYGCYDCDELNWTRELSDHVFQKDNPFDWFIISYTATGGMLQHLAKGNVRGLTKTEKVIVVAILLTGYLEHIMIFFGRLNAAFLKKFRRQHSFEVRLKRIRALLQDWHVNKELKEKTLNFYNKLWSKTSGVENVGNIIKTSYENTV